MSEHVKPLVMVTGAARGIGLACASRFFDDGYQVAMCDIDVAKVEAEAARLDANAATSVVDPRSPTVPARNAAPRGIL